MELTVVLISVFFNADWRLRRPVLHGVRAWCCHSGGTLASSQSMHSQPPVVLVHPRTQEWFGTDRVAACERGEEPRTSRSSMVMGAGESCQSFPPALMRSLPRPAGRRHRNVNGFRPCKSAVVVCLRRHVGADTALTGSRLPPQALHRRCCGSKRAAEEVDGTSRALTRCRIGNSNARYHHVGLHADRRHGVFAVHVSETLARSPFVGEMLLETGKALVSRLKPGSRNAHRCRPMEELARSGQARVAAFSQKKILFVRRLWLVDRLHQRSATPWRQDDVTSMIEPIGPMPSPSDNPWRRRQGVLDPEGKCSRASEPLLFRRVGALSDDRRS